MASGESGLGSEASGGGGLGVGFIDIVPRADKFVSSLQSQMTKAFGSVQKSIGSTNALTTGLTVGFVALGAAAVKAISAGISATTEWASQVRGFQRITGQTAESASALLAVTSHLGIDSSKAATSFGIFAKNVSTGSKALDAYGIATTDATGQLLPFDTILGNTADAISALPPGLKQAAAAKALFGRAGIALLPLLTKEAAGIDELKGEAADLGLVMSQNDVDAAKSLTLAQNDLREAMKGASISIGKDFIPIVTDMVHILTDAVEVFTKIPAPIKDTIFGITALTGAIAAFKIVFGFFSNAWKPLLKFLGEKVIADQAIVASSGEAGTAMVAEGAAADELAGSLGTASTASEGFAASAGLIAGAVGAAAFGIGAGFLILKSKYDQWKSASAATATELQNDMATLTFGTKKQQQSIIDLANTSEDELRAIASTWDRTQLQSKALIAQQALEQFAGAAADTRPILVKLFDGLDPATTKLADVPLAMQTIVSKLRDSFTGLSQLSKSTGQDFESVGSELQAALQDPALTLDKLPGLFANTIGKMRQVMQGWRASIEQALGGAGSALSKFADQQNVSVTKATESLDRYTTQVKTMGTSLVSIHEKYGKAANDFIQWATEQGLSQIGLTKAVAAANKKQGQSFIDSFNTGTSATQQFAKTMTSVLGKAFDSLLTSFKRMWNQILVALGREPIFKINTAPAEAAVANLRQSILNLPTSTVLDIKTGGSGAQHGGYIGQRGYAGFAAGGSTDTIPAMLTPGEFVMRREAVERIGVPALRTMNAGGVIPSAVAVGKPHKLDGTLRVADWRNGLATLDGELSWEDTVRTR